MQRIQRVLRHMSASQQRLSSTASIDRNGILATQHGITTLVTLNKPRVLNSLDGGMVQVLSPLYKSVAGSGQGRVLVMKGEGEKAFCAGGDIKAIYDGKKEGQTPRTLTQFFKEEYILNQQIANLPEHVPHVALIDGITMGGGVGLSVHGRYRVATERTMFAMPETAIGFFCDVGGSLFLPRLKHNIGMWLALTGSRLKGADVFHAGVATHYVPSERLGELEEKLLQVSDPSEVGPLLDGFHEGHLANTFTQHVPCIERCFRKDTVEDIITALEQEQSDDKEWAQRNLKMLSRMSPTSLKVVHRQIVEGATKGIHENFEMELTMAHEFMQQPDFFEGVRALLVDKDRKPQWQPASLAEVRGEAVEKYFHRHADQLSFDEM